jgi:hypothetical protein
MAALSARIARRSCNTREAAAHDAFNGHFARPAVLHGRTGRGRQHAFRPAGVDHDALGRRQPGEPPIERRDHASAFAQAAVFGRQHEIDAEVAKKITVEEFPGAAGAVEERAPHAAVPQRRRERREGRQSNAARDHPGLRRRIDDGKRTAERSQAVNPLSLARIVEQRRRHADPLAQDREPDGLAARIAKNLED